MADNVTPVTAVAATAAAAAAAAATASRLPKSRWLQDDSDEEDAAASAAARPSKRRKGAAAPAAAIAKSAGTPGTPDAVRRVPAKTGGRPAPGLIRSDTMLVSHRRLTQPVAQPLPALARAAALDSPGAAARTPTLTAAGSGSESPTVVSGRAGNETPTRAVAAEGALPALATSAARTGLTFPYSLPYLIAAAGPRPTPTPAPAPAPAPLHRIPFLSGCRSVDNYEKLNKIDEGTYGMVYRARDRETKRVVALKRLKIEKEKVGTPGTAAACWRQRASDPPGPPQVLVRATPTGRVPDHVAARGPHTDDGEPPQHCQRAGDCRGRER